MMFSPEARMVKCSPRSGFEDSQVVYVIHMMVEISLLHSGKLDVNVPG
jgi:hypothetical protein